MSEFKIDQYGQPYLIEINGRLWGSVQLAIDAGVNFPLHVCNLALGRPIDSRDDYKIAVRSAWFAGAIDRLYAQLKGEFSLKPWRELLSVLGSRQDVARLTDPMPFITELLRYVSAS
jgi:hypothetical protein